MFKLRWIPGEAEWLPIRNRLMLALAYDSALRREELCALRTDDLDPRTARSGCGLRRQDPPGAGGDLVGGDRGAAVGLPRTPCRDQPRPRAAVFRVSAQSW